MVDGAYVKVEVMPRLPGCPEVIDPDQEERDGYAAQVIAHIESHLQYPAMALEEGITGKVYVRYIVDANGQVGRLRVMRGVHPSLDKEALRVVSTLPQHTPGRHQGKSVPVVFHVPVTFTRN